MNMLKKFKYIALTGFALAFSLTLASCKKEEADPNGFYESTINKSADGYNFDEARLSSITIDTSKAKTVFFLGEAFTADGVTITANFLNDDRKLGSLVTTDFTVDAKEVDMYNIGTYSVTIIYRYKDTVQKQKYSISVVSSVFESTPNLEYYSGLEATFADYSRIKNYLLNDKAVAKYADVYDHGFDLNELVSGIKVKLHKNKTNSAGTASEEIFVQELSSSDVKVEASAVNINAVGEYVVKVTYEAPEIEIAGVKYNDNVVAFLIINVDDPISSIQISSGTRVFEQSIDGINAEKASWKVHVVPTVAAAYDEDFTYDKYDIEDLDIFNTKSNQTIKVILKDDPSVSCTYVIKITESTTESITSYYDLVPTLSDFVNDKPTKVTLADTDFIFGPLPAKVDSTSYYNSGATYTSNRSSSDRYESIGFEERISIKNSDQAIKIVMDKPGKIVVFYASTGDEERELVLYNDLDGKLGSELQTAVTPGTKQIITRETFIIPEAGTYYFVNPTGGIYVHGFLIATAK